jgi:hypothetical protein
MTDTEAVGFLTASSWERMATQAQEHHRAENELIHAELEDFLMPSLESTVRLQVALVALHRAEKRMGR